MPYREIITPRFLRTDLASSVRTWLSISQYGPHIRLINSNTKPEVLKYGPSLRGPCVKNEGLVFHGTAQSIRLINSLLHDKKRKCTEHSLRICRQFSEKLFFTKLVQNHFSKVSVDFQIFQKLSESSSPFSRKIIAHEFYQKHFPEFYNFPKFSENF